MKSFLLVFFSVTVALVQPAINRLTNSISTGRFSSMNASDDRAITSDKFVDASSFGAIPDDDKSDNTSINKAISYAVRNGIPEVRLKPGTYIIAAPIVFQSNVSLNGIDKSTTKLVAAGSTDGFPFVLMENVQRSGIRNLSLDGNAVVRSTRKGNGAVFITEGSNSNIVENLYITNFGSPNVGGNYLTISASEDDASGSSNNVIRNCVLVDKNSYSHFGIRLYTNWNTKLPSDQFKNLVSNNVVDSCRFEGGFIWNVIELAGPGTVNNTISRCYTIGSTGNSGFEADKGASNNLFKDNVVEDLGSYTLESTYAYRSQGLKKPDFDRLAVGNKFYNNKAINIHNKAFANTGGILVFHSKNVDLVGNTISNIKYQESSGGKPVAAIYINDVSDVRIKNNYIEKVGAGVWVVGGSNNSNVKIQNNTFSNTNIAYKSFATGKKENIQFNNNKLMQRSIKIMKSNEGASDISVN